MEGTLHEWQLSNKFNSVVLGVDLNMTILGSIDNVTGTNMVAGGAKKAEGMREII